MAEQDLVKTARSIVDAFNKGDYETIRTNVSPNTVYNEVGTHRQIRGADAFIAALQGWKTAMPDVTGKIANAFASGNHVVLEVTYSGTQTGAFEGPTGTLKPSGKHQTTPTAWILEFQGDQVKESHQYFDLFSLLQQLGALPQPAMTR